MSVFIRVLKVELWKALHNPMFWTAILISAGLSVLSSFESYQMVQELKERIIRSPFQNYQGASLFLFLLCVAAINSSSRLFIALWAILAAIPYGWSFCREKKTGSYLQEMIRSGRTNYFRAKYIAVFVSGGLTTALPFLLNLMVNALFCPYVLPDPAAGTYPVMNGWFLSKLFYTHPWSWALIWIGMAFVIGGVTAGLCLVPGSTIRFATLVILFPYALFYLLDVLLNAFVYNRMVVSTMFSPAYLIIAVPPSVNPPWLVFTEIIVICLLGIAAGRYWIIRHEL